MPRMKHVKDEYHEYIEHPRYGRGPKITGLNPETVFGGDVFIHWHSPKECRIPNTAIPADLTRQTIATFPVTHYYDVKRKCVDCGKLFIFFAEEQKYWYEELGFGLDTDCIRCVLCRRQQRGIAQLRERYVDLFHNSNRTIKENLEMAECCLTLIEQSIFHKRQIEKVRMLIKKIEDKCDKKMQNQVNILKQRMVKTLSER